MFSGHRGVGTAIIVVLLLLPAVPQASLQAFGSASSLPLGPARPGLPRSLAGVPAQAAPPVYDEQIGATFTEDFTSLAYNVTAVAQADADGYGPGYLLNGLTYAGYWYQVGISYHWPDSSGSHFPGFGFNYQVYGPSGKPVYPANGGAGEAPFLGVVNPNDIVLLSLTFTPSTVQMRARDWNTGAIAQASYSNQGSAVFAGDPSSGTNFNGYFSGIMTEWYHSSLYTSNVEQVTYTNDNVALASAWMWIDQFKSGAANPLIFLNQTKNPVVFANEHQLYSFSAGGATSYMSAHQFITGELANATSSWVTLSPALDETSSPSFSATYTLAGHQQSAVLSAGTNLVQTDPGSFITVSINSTVGPSERWVFNGTSGTVVTLAGGTNATFVYYHLVEETVSYQVSGAGEGPPPSPPELSYQEPPPLASGTAIPTTVTQALGTESTVVFAILGSVASVGASIPGVPGERWAPAAQNWTVTAPYSIPDPIMFFHQFLVSVRYSIVGGGSPSQTPEFNSTALGAPAVTRLSTAPTTGWFDAKSAYSFTRFLNSSAATERWQQVGGGASSNVSSAAGGGPIGELALEGVNAPNEVIEADYVHQFYTRLDVNDAKGGSVAGTFTGTVANGTVQGDLTPGPGWLDAGLSLSVAPFANQGWQFEGWTGSGQGSYTGTNPSIQVSVEGPLNESATFYAQLSITAGAGTNVAYSYGTEAGTVDAGTTRTDFVPPSTNVTLRASPSLFLYAFASWKGENLTAATTPSLAVVVDSPSSVTAASSLNYQLLLPVVAVIVLIAASLWVRSRRRSASPSEGGSPAPAWSGPGPGQG